MRKFLVTSLLLGISIHAIFHATGLYPYVRSILRPLRPSMNDTRSDDIFISRKQPKGTVLLVHGMNFDASKMEPLGREMAQFGFEVFIPRLAGHRGLRSETHEYTAEKWSDQMLAWSDRLKPRKICSGFSLGGLLVVQNYLEGRIDCDRFLLFAPALALRTPIPVAEWVEKLWPMAFSIPSGIPDDYKHFSILGLATTFPIWIFRS